MIDCSLLLQRNVPNLAINFPPHINRKKSMGASLMYVGLTTYGCHLGTATLAAWPVDTHFYLRFSLPASPGQQWQRPTSRRWRGMKEKSLFNHCLPQLLSTPPHSTPHQDHPNPPQSKYLCQPQLTTEVFPPHSYYFSVSLLGWPEVERRKGKRGRMRGNGGSSEFHFLSLAHFSALTQSFSSKSMSLFYIPESFFKKLATFNLLDSTY